MKKINLFLITGVLLIFAQQANSQTFTMSKKCREQIDLANRMNADKQYDSAIAVFDAITKQCNSKDGKEAVAIGKAHAYNGKKQYTEAMAAANAALAVSKNTSLNGFFERGIANEGLKNSEAAKADFNQIIALTEKNQNVKERATIYAKIADMNYQSGKMAEGDSNLARAMELDPANTNFPIQKGDMYVKQGKYDQAFENYDIAVDAGRTDLDMYIIRTNARMKMVQEKYGTTVAQELRTKMTAKEKEQVCVEMKKALELGLKDMKQEMFSALVCK
ncbi:MAG: tetratricopeptide repeat protein [Chitinophagaceae bacterium]